LSFAIPILCGLAGAIAGWFVLHLVDRVTKTHGRMATILSTAAAGVIALTLAIKFGSSGAYLYVYGALALVLLGVTVYDLRKFEIPHVVTLPGIVTGLLIGTYVLPLGFTGSAMGLVVGGGVLLVATIVESIRKKEIGGGDWKYAAMIGSFIGPQKIIVALVLTGVFGFIGAVVLAISGSAARPHALGPWLSAGAVASILLG
jgi:leader peptidase (prepilin peptidase) / N-methyltransferase